MDILINKYDLFIFDLNNTIVQVEDYHYKAWLKTLQDILGLQLTFSFDFFCEHFHPKDSKSIKNYLSTKLNLHDYDGIMKQKNTNMKINKILNYKMDLN